MNCIHYHIDDPLTCDAFTDEIPQEIWIGGDPHILPFEGDHGIQFDRTDEAQPQSRSAQGNPHHDAEGHFTDPAHEGHAAPKPPKMDRRGKKKAELEKHRQRGHAELAAMRQRHQDQRAAMLKEHRQDRKEHHAEHHADRKGLVEDQAAERKDRLREHRGELKEQGRDHARELKEQERDHAREHRDLDREHRGDKRDLAKDHADAQRDLREAHADEMKGLSEKEAKEAAARHEGEMRELMDEQTGDVDALAEQHQSARENLRDEHDQAVKDLKDEHAAAAKGLEGDHADDLESLRAEHAEYRQTILREQEESRREAAERRRQERQDLREQHKGERQEYVEGFKKGLEEAGFKKKSQAKELLSGPKPSAAQIAMKRGERKLADKDKENIAKVFGKEVNEQELANLSGLHDGEFMVSTKSYEISIQGGTDEYNLARVIKIDEDDPTKLILKASLFEVDPNHQGKGIGTDVFDRMVEQASALGIDRIVCHASRGKSQNGYYTWARFGYDGPLPKEMNEPLPEALQSAKTVSDLMKTPEGAAWWKEHGEGMAMSFDLKDGSQSKQVWDAYKKAKAAKAKA
jgi:GNAT superfamily N-acetyltransferase